MEAMVGRDPGSARLPLGGGTMALCEKRGGIAITDDKWHRAAVNSRFFVQALQIWTLEPLGTERCLPKNLLRSIGRLHANRVPGSERASEAMVATQLPACVAPEKFDT